MLLLSLLLVIHDGCAAAALQTLVHLTRGNIKKEVENKYQLPHFIRGKKTTPLHLKTEATKLKVRYQKELKDLNVNYI